MSQLSCGVDLGSTNVKVTLVDGGGRTVWTQAVPTPRRPDGDGVATDVRGLVDLVETMVIAGWRAHGDGRPIRAIAAAGVGEDGVGVAADLGPTGLALPWFDNRAADEAADLQRGSRHATRAGLLIDPSRTAAKWLWLKRHRPEALAGAACWIALTDYPAVAWTGRPFMSETLAARTACYDVYARRWIEPLLEASSAPALPPVVPAGHVVGYVAKGPLRESGAASAATAVVAGGHDHMVAAAAIRRLSPDAFVDSLGTANLAYGETILAGEPRLDPYIAFSVPSLGGAGLSCLGVFELAAAVDPLRRRPDLVTALLGEDRLPGDPGNAAMPFPPFGHPEAPTRVHPTAGDVRRTLEAASYYARRMFDAIKDAGARPGPIFATGGWSRSRSFMELRASIYGHPVTVVEEPELTAVGAALIAMAGDGNPSPRFGEGLRLRTIDPVPAWLDAYAAGYAAFRVQADDRANRAPGELT